MTVSEHDGEDSPERAFVILRHIVGPALARDVGDHFDWMFQVDDDPSTDLRTWSMLDLPTWDAGSDSFQGAVEGQWLPDHRARYLTYQGDVSGQRGRVTRCLEGRYRVLDESTRHWFIRIVSWKSAELDLDWPDRWDMRLTWTDQSRLVAARFVGIR